MAEDKIVRGGVGGWIFNLAGQVLIGKRLSKHGTETWAVPGGHLEFGENPQQCASREIFEETGIKISPDKFEFISYTNDIFGEKHYITIHLRVNGINDIPQIMEPDKCEKWEWVDIDKLPEPLFLPVKNLLAQKVLKCARKIQPFNLDNAKIVILGTFPGEKSLEKGEYYSNPTNQFWDLIGINEKDYEIKTKKLKEMSIGLWDVIESCDRTGSVDKNIQNEGYNDLSKLKKTQKIFFNGKKAYEYYEKANKKHNFNLNVSKENILPSSSRACAIKDKKQQWQKVLGKDKK